MKNIKNNINNTKTQKKNKPIDKILIVLIIIFIILLAIVVWINIKEKYGHLWYRPNPMPIIEHEITLPNGEKETLLVDNWSGEYQKNGITYKCLCEIRKRMTLFLCIETNESNICVSNDFCSCNPK
jgi:hypothetical protein